MMDQPVVGEDAFGSNSWWGAVGWSWVGVIGHYTFEPGPITKEDNMVHGSGKVHSWKTCKKTNGSFCNRETIGGPRLQAYTSLCVCVCEYVYTFKAGTL